jgi:cytochrome c5
MRLATALGVILVVLDTACQETPKGTEEAEDAVWQRVQTDEALEHGRSVWLVNCKRCHAHGIEGAPRIGSTEDWSKRSGKELGLLVKSVVNGVQGKAGGEMPPRAGNEDLTDAEIESAVRFMVSVSR